MPTGVALQDPREQLFTAAERILLRAGPQALTSRAVTTEAGCAKGVLHHHFADFDDFLAELVRDRVTRLDARKQALLGAAGSGTVLDNLTAELTGLFETVAVAIVALITFRDDLRVRLRQVTPTGVPLLTEAAAMLGAYLAAERDLGRLTWDADVATLAPTLLGAAHLLFAGRDTTPPAPATVHRTVATVMASVVQEPRHKDHAPPRALSLWAKQISPWDRKKGTMTALPGWMDLPPEGLSAADYEALPEDVCRRIEVVDGAIVVNTAPRRLHQIVARRLANVLEEASGPGLAVATDVDLRLRDVPLLNRRPDIVIFDASVPDDAVLRPASCLLVAEVMSPGSVTTDQIDKPAEYAAAQIEHYWRIEQNAEDALTVFRYLLDPTTGSYASAGAHTATMVVSEPFAVTIDLGDLS